MRSYRVPILPIVALLGSLVLPSAVVAGPPSFSASFQHNNFDFMTEDGKLVSIYNDGSGKLLRSMTTGGFIELSNGGYFEETIETSLTIPGGFTLLSNHFDDAPNGRMLLFFRSGTDESKGGFWTKTDTLISFTGPENKMEVNYGEVNASGYAAVTARVVGGTPAKEVTAPFLVSPSGGLTEITSPRVRWWGGSEEIDVDAGVIIGVNEASATAINANNAVACSASGFVYDEIEDDYDNYKRWSFVSKGGEILYDDLPYGATDINDKNEVVGYDWYSNRTWIFRPGSGVETISNGGGHTSSVIVKINNAGAVVWTGFSAGSPARYWKGGAMYTLKNLVASEEEFEILRVRDINNFGQILVDDETPRPQPDGSTFNFRGSRLLSGSSIRIEFEGAESLEPEQEFLANVIIQHAGLTPSTYRFPQGADGIFLTATPNDRVEIMESDLPEEVVLSPSEPQATFPIRCKALERGLILFETEVEATPQGGGTATTLSAEEELFISPLKVSLRMIPDVDEKPISFVKIEEDEDGNPIITDGADNPNGIGNPVTPKVKVTIENQGPDSLHCFLQGVDPRARDLSPVSARIKTLGAFPMDLGMIAGKTTITREIDLEFSEDGRFEFDALVTAGVTGSSSTFAEPAIGAPLAVGEKFPVEIELEVVQTPVIGFKNNGAYLIQPGGTIKVIASVNNLTTNATLEFYGMRAEKHLNAIGAHLTSDDGNLVEPPHVHDHKVEANASVVLSGLILTDPDGAPAGTVKWSGLEDIKITDDATEEERELTMADVLVTGDDAGWLEDDLSIRVIQNYSRPLAPSPITFTQEVAIYSHGAMIGVGEWTYDTFDAIGGIGRLAGTISADPSLLADAWGEGSRAVWEAAELASTIWNEMSDEERLEFIRTVGPEVARRLALYSATRSPVAPEDNEALAAFVNAAVYSQMGGVSAAYASDDPAQIADMWGRVSGHVGLEVVTALIPNNVLTKYVKASELTILSKNQTLGRALTQQEEKLRTIISGPIDVETSRKVFGVGSEDIARFRRIFRHFKVKGYARERAPISYKLINEWGEAVWKPENMKPKGFSELDGLIIGGDLPTLPGLKDPSRTIELEGITTIFWPEPDYVIRNRLAAKGTPKEVIDAALSRAADRREEFQKFAPKFNKWKDDHFSVAKNYKDNGVPDPDPLKSDMRDFEFDVIDLGPNRPQLRIPKMANIDGDLRYISGDIDWIHFSFLDGSPLDPDTARKLYDALSRCCGLQHPETITWIRHGQSVFKAKANQITEYVRGQKALFELSEHGPRAVRISEALTRFAKNNRKHLIFFENGVKSRERAKYADIETALATIQSLYPRPIITPFLWYSKANSAGDDTMIDGNDWAYTTVDGDEIIVRQTSDGSTERFNGSQWEPWTPPVAPPSGDFSPPPSDRIALSPTTALDKAVIAGGDVLEIVDLPNLWADELAGHVDNWFEPGQSIIIDPGELTQEVHVVASIEPLTLVDSLKHDHPEGAIVAVLPTSLTPTPPSDTDSKLLSTTIEGDYITLLWTSIPGAVYALEVADDETLVTWTLVRESIFSDSVALGVILPIDEYDEDATYRLRYVGQAPEPVNFSSITLDPQAGTILVDWPNEGEEDYLIEVSETLEPDSWGTVLPEFEEFGDMTRAVLPLDTAAVPARFYRARQAGENYAGRGSLQILGMTHDEVESTLTITWAAEPGDTYVLESKEHNGDLMWRSVADTVTATDFRVTLVLEIEPNSDPDIYRVREVDP